jgi:hypothetical protein
MRIPYKWAIAPPVAGLLALACCFADNPARDRPPTGADRDLIVHEWGTFSTFSGSDGKNLKFYPYDNDLPDFVHGYQSSKSKEGPQGGLISLETPVLYFYSDHPLTASVQVEFPQGTMTEWYPHAIRTDKKLSWKGIQVRPGERMKLPTEEKKSRYYAARETDATPLRVSFRGDDGPATEQEKFLFYRGVGDFDLPLTVRAQGGGKFHVSWECKAPQDPQDDLILVQIDGGKCRFRPFRIGDLWEADVQIPDADSTTDKLGETMVTLLTEKGLTEKEARAMVKTWSSAWFGEEGTRVLYLLPAETTDKLLPLTIDPKPVTLVRVLVGRHDVLTPEREKQIEGWVAKVRGETDDAGRQAALESLAKLGRYRDAAWGEAEARLQKKKR